MPFRDNQDHDQVTESCHEKHLPEKTSGYRKESQKTTIPNLPLSLKPRVASSSEVPEYYLFHLPSRIHLQAGSPDE